jgi:hypothetical protein
MDRVLFSMPDKLWGFLLAIPVVQDYQIQLAVGAQRGARDKNYEVTIRMKEEFSYFEPILRMMKDNIPIFDYTGWDEIQRDDFDCFIDFDFERAIELARVPRKHIVDSFGMLIGAGPRKWPDIRALRIKPPGEGDPQGDVLIMKWDDIESERLEKFILSNYPQLGVSYDARDLSKFEEEPQSILEYMNLFHIIIGPVGVMTYAAATMKKAVIEVFPSMVESYLYNNSGLPLYKAVIGTEIKAEFMWTVWEDILQKYQDTHTLDMNTSSPKMETTQ